MRHQLSGFSIFGSADVKFKKSRIGNVSVTYRAQQMVGCLQPFDPERYRLSVFAVF